MSEDLLHDMLGEVDIKKNAQVDFGEFLQVRTARACVVHLRFVAFNAGFVWYLSFKV